MNAFVLLNRNEKQNATMLLFFFNLYEINLTKNRLETLQTKTYK